MRTFGLLLLGAVVGWASAGVDWTDHAFADEETKEVVPPLPHDPLVPEASLPKSDKSLLADEPTAPIGAIRTRFIEERIVADADGRKQIVREERLVPPGCPQCQGAGSAGRYQVTAYGATGGHGCYIVDTATGQVFHSANAQPPMAVGYPLSSYGPVAAPITPQESAERVEPGAPIRYPQDAHPEPALMPRTTPPSYREPSVPQPQAPAAD
ncbi:hypothetical protein [Lacipirellula sp.]|uniref:hypothetical protein n=1 Tax=Lacipirellula sp. TaxID=2691419 RepID=UPI003D0A6922